MDKSLARDANTAGLGDCLKTGSDVHAIAVDALLVVDNVAEVDAYAVAHLTFYWNAGIALRHNFLDGNRALDRVHDTGELSKDAIAGGVDDVSTMFGYHRKYHCLVSFEVADGCFLVRFHERAIACNVRR